MNGSIKWLANYVDISWPVDELAERLTRIGTPVENTTSPDLRLKNVIAVEVKQLEKHPDADKLSVATIWDGQTDHRVITGASNMKVGDKLFWAQPGSELPTGQKIEKAVLRGIESPGMLCSATELCLDSKLESEESKGGLLIAHSETIPGDDYLTAMGLDSAVYEFELTANRADCFSMVGLAREIAVLTESELKTPAIIIEEYTRIESSKEISIKIDAPDLCSRFVGQVMTDIQVGPSPLWLVQALQSIGLRSINNVVDVTNYVMMEMGQPLHAYELDQLVGKTLIARRAKADEIIITLDEKERKLTSEMLVIADAEKAVGVAGVMGGLHSEVTGNTTNIVIEGAAFHGPSIRKTSRALGLRSDASSRFERGIDQQRIELAVLRTAQLLQEMGAGKIATGYIDVKEKTVQSPKISYTVEKINQFLGVNVPEASMTDILSRLGCTVEKGTDQEWITTPPSWRTDITIFEDLAEEIIRIYGFDNVPATLPVSTSEVVQLPKLSQVERKTTDFMAELGFNQCVHFSFTYPEMMKKLQLDENSMIPVFNPIVDELSHMKTTLLGDLLVTLQKNQAQKRSVLKFFEVARVFLPKSLPIKELPTENLMISAVATGESVATGWNQKPSKVDFYFMKGICETLIQKLGLTDIEFLPETHPALHPGRTAVIYFKGKCIGWIGEIHPEVQQNMDILSPTYYFELNLSEVEVVALPIRKYKIFGRLPSVYRDLAFVLPEEVNSNKVQSLILASANELLKECELFDVYQGENLEKGKKSMAFSLRFQDSERTLEEKDIEPLIQNIIEAIQKEFKGELRS